MWDRANFRRWGIVMVYVCELSHLEAMKHERNNQRDNTAGIYVAVIVFILLLILWLTIADLWGATDVNAVLPRAV